MRHWLSSQSLQPSTLATGASPRTDLPDRLTQAAVAGFHDTIALLILLSLLGLGAAAFLGKGSGQDSLAVLHGYGHDIGIRDIGIRDTGQDPFKQLLPIR